MPQDETCGRGSENLPALVEWSETHLAIRDAFRRFVEAEIKPRLVELELGDTPPYSVLRSA